MFLILFAVFVVLPLVEIAVLIQVGSSIGVWPTIGLLLTISVLGALLVKHQGMGVLRAMRAQLALGQLPAAELVDAVLILAAGLLLLVPGFVSDAIGLVLLIPFVRAVPRRWFRRRLSVRIATGVAGAGGAYTVRARERVRNQSDRTTPPVPPALGP